MFDWNKYEAKASSMSNAELLWSIKDCREAEKAMRGWNPEREGHYSDEASVYSAELARRAKK